MTLGLNFVTGMDRFPHRFRQTVLFNRGTSIFYCSSEDCVNSMDRVTEICQENQYPAGQEVPTNFIGGGVFCLCPCPAPAALDP